MTTTRRRSLVEARYYTPDAVAACRAWCEDVVADPDTVDEASDDEVMTYVAEHYCGGLASALLDLAPAEVWG
jgi:hypothetical protein